jgi:fibro-slime domain-containing protein
MEIVIIDRCFSDCLRGSADCAGRQRMSAEVNIDDFNSINGMGMVWGRTYPMRIFHAGRNPTQSNFHITTSIGCFTTPIV